MARTYTEQALFIVENLSKVAKRDNTISKSRTIQFHPNGTIFIGKDKISKAAATQTLAALLEKEELAIEENSKPAKKPAKKPRSKGPMTWESLNEATKEYFFEIAKEIKDDKGVLIKPGLKNAPRLSNLKRVGVIAKTGDSKGVEITDIGKNLLADI